MNTPKFGDCPCPAEDEDWHKIDQKTVDDVDAVLYECRACGTVDTLTAQVKHV